MTQTLFSIQGCREFVEVQHFVKSGRQEMKGVRQQIKKKQLLAPLEEHNFCKKKNHSIAVKTLLERIMGRVPKVMII